LKEGIGNMNYKNNILYGSVMLVFLFAYSLAKSDDNEIFVNQVGATANIDLEQLGSGNIIGGLESAHGSMTEFDLDGATMTLDVNQIGNNNKMLGDINADTLTGLFDFDGDTNSYTIQIDPGNANSADVDTIVQGSSNTVHIDLDVDSGTNYIDLDGDSNSVDYNGDGYAGVYFKLEHDGSTRSFDIDQQSTQDNDWLRVTSTGSGGSVCINQSDQGTSTSC